MKASSDAGRFRHRLELKRADEISDGCGGFTTTWTLIAFVWADISPVGTKEHFVEATSGSKITHRIKVRWRGECEREMRFEMGSRIFTIEHCYDPDETLRYLICECEEQK